MTLLMFAALLTGVAALVDVLGVARNLGRAVGIVVDVLAIVLALMVLFYRVH